MSKQSNHDNTEEKKLNPSEGIRQTGQKIHTQKDERSVEDDAMDYVFMTPKKAHHHHDSQGTVRRVHRHHHRKKKRKKILTRVGCGLLAFILLLTAVAVILIIRGQFDLFTNDYHVIAPNGVNVSENGQTIVYNGHTYKLNDQVTNMLFIGVDKTNINEMPESGLQGQADVLIMAAYDTKHRKLSLINIPRDLMTDVPIYTANGVYASTKRQQICLAYAYGDSNESSCGNTVDTVTRLFYNMPIKTYFALDIDGIAALNDSIGGVDVVSPENIAEFKKDCSYHLMGKQAESFVRSRSHTSADANLKRNERQKTYVTSYMNDMFSAMKKNISVPVDIFNASAPYSCTNMSVTRVAYFAKEFAFGGTPETQILRVDGNMKLNGKYAEYELKEKEFYEMFLSVYYDMIA